MKRLSVLAAAMLLLGLCACSRPAGDGTSSSLPASAPAAAETPAPAETAAPTQPPAPTEAPAPAETPEPTASEPAHVSVAFAGDALPEGSYDEFDDTPTGYDVRLVLTTDTAVKDLRFLALTFVDSDAEGNLSFGTEALYTADTLTPERPLVLGMAFGGLLPDRGISYIDTDGCTKCFTLELSGEDGSPLLVPFTP